MSAGDTVLTFCLLIFILVYCLAPIIHYCIRCNDCCRKNNIKKYAQAKKLHSKSKSKPNEISTIERDGHKTQEQIDKSFENDFSFWRYISMYFHVGVIGLVLFIIIINVTSDLDPTTVKGLGVLCYLCLGVSVLCILYEILTSYECKYVSNFKQEKPLIEYLKGNLFELFQNLFIFRINCNRWT